MMKAGRVALFPLLPEFHFHRYREIVRVLLNHGLEFLFARLDPQWAPIRRFLRLPAGSVAAPSMPDEVALHLRLALEELGVTFIKLGQILSTRPDLLPPEFIRELSRLQDSVPPLPWEVIRPVIEQELGRPLEDVFAWIDPQPLASASLAQVHFARLYDGKEVVLKVQRPGVPRQVKVDLDILTAWARRVAGTRLGQYYDFVGVVDEFAFTLRNELDYRREARNAERFRRNFAGEPYLHIPEVYWQYTTQRLLVMEYLNGIKIDQFDRLRAEGYDLKRIALNSARIVIKEVLEDGFFHADPHPGNFVILPGEVIGAMDFGMVGFLRECDRADLVRLYIVSVRLDAEGIVDQLIRMGAADVHVNRKQLALDINRLLMKYANLPLKEIRAREVIEEVTPIMFRHHLRLPSNLWLLGKTLAMMEGIGLQLDPDFDVFAVSEPYVQKLTLEMFLPNRAWLEQGLQMGMEWEQFIRALPRTGLQMLEDLERREPLPLQIAGAERFMTQVHRLFIYLVFGILLAALIVALAFLLAMSPTGDWTRILLGGALFLVLGVSIGLLISMFWNRPR
ncbi:hypothetical protein ANT_27150 [Anaerolinea thermophila UNI-1]|uniref:ABC1 atypical kinase-like domain-containing protein n=1 Tax=Anaerolinea thermophila (strain DSM 14523 / JCM 11388 / NBRC 100420 / UNI-1) TaxID=926569 RepID=E8N0J2_ANATU|nr:hypothetical protein ANT_27150 [Anaerolinea thermophila UNI-1]